MNKKSTSSNFLYRNERTTDGVRERVEKVHTCLENNLTSFSISTTSSTPFVFFHYSFSTACVGLFEKYALGHNVVSQILAWYSYALLKKHSYWLTQMQHPIKNMNCRPMPTGLHPLPVGIQYFLF